MRGAVRVQMLDDDLAPTAPFWRWASTATRSASRCTPTFGRRGQEVLSGAGVSTLGSARMRVLRAPGKLVRIQELR
jgi:hypothetical protein